MTPIISTLASRRYKSAWVYGLRMERFQVPKTTRPKFIQGVWRSEDFKQREVHYRALQARELAELKAQRLRTQALINKLFVVIGIFCFILLLLILYSHEKVKLHEQLYGH